MRDTPSLRWFEEKLKMSLASSPHLGGQEYLVFRIKELAAMVSVGGNSILCLLATVAASMTQSMVTNFCSTGKTGQECCDQCEQLANLANAMQQIAAGNGPQPDPAPSPENAGKPQAPKPAAK